MPLSSTMPAYHWAAVKVKLKGALERVPLDSDVTAMTLASCPEGQSCPALASSAVGGWECTCLHQPGPLGSVAQLGVAEHPHLIGLAWGERGQGDV